MSGDSGTRSLVAFNYTIGSSRTSVYLSTFDLANALSFAGLNAKCAFGDGTYYVLCYGRKQVSAILGLLLDVRPLESLNTQKFRILELSI